MAAIPIKAAYQESRSGSSKAGLQTMAFLGNYTPQKGGPATFTSDLLCAVSARYPESWCYAVAISDSNGSYRYPAAVRFEIGEQQLESYRKAAEFMNASKVDLVSVHHEFGIYGGVEGCYLLELLRLITAPIVTTLHGVVARPNPGQFGVMRELIALSSRLVVTTERSRTILEEVYGAPSDKIDLIPRGRSDQGFAAKPVAVRSAYAG